MKQFVALLSLFAVSYARPEAPYVYTSQALPSSSASFSSQQTLQTSAQEPFHIYGNPDQVHRHVYVYDTPFAPEEIGRGKILGGGGSQKHYKIIFIKAPQYVVGSQSIPVQAQNQEKTLIYVLAKKPDDAQSITIPTAPPTAPSKPEVYFIKYKNQKTETGGYTDNRPVDGGILVESGFRSKKQAEKTQAV